MCNRSSGIVSNLVYGSLPKSFVSRWSATLPLFDRGRVARNSPPSSIIAPGSSLQIPIYECLSTGDDGPTELDSVVVFQAEFGLTRGVLEL